MRHIFIVGSKGIPGAYGGYETFVDKLTEYHRDQGKLKYHVACRGDAREEFEYQNAHCFQIAVPDIGAAAAVYYDVAALIYCCRYIERNCIKDPVIYILTCRIGPFIKYFNRKIHRLGGTLALNPDGHEWMRRKWPLPVRKYWKISEKKMVGNSDIIICDSMAIESYIHRQYDGKRPGGQSPRTTYIAYGADVGRSTSHGSDKKYHDWLQDNGLKPKDYYLIVGRFVPENNYETIIREFMRSASPRHLAIVTNVNDRFLGRLRRALHYECDARIHFVGAVYDQELLRKIRENAYGYFHGHEVGGTNPSLVESLNSTDLNFLLDVEFNREVAGDAALYWTKKAGSLSGLVERADGMSEVEIADYGRKAKGRIAEAYSWQSIADKYEEIFMREGFRL